MSRHQDLFLGMGSAPWAIHTPGFIPGLPPSILTLKNGGYFAAPSISPRTSITAGSAAAPGAPVLLVPWAPNLWSCSAAWHTEGRTHPPLFLIISLVSAPSPLAEAVSGWGN